jgi:hypothetical protein
MHIDDHEITVSFDFISLSTKIPLSQSISLISKLIDLETINLIEIFISSTFFTFKGFFYEQPGGTTMGFSLSLVVANIFMENFEYSTLNNFHLKPKCWFRFVDDTFVIWPHGLSNLTSFFQHHNNLSPHIQFTIESQKDNSIPLLDFFISILPNGSLSHQVYRKNTHTDSVKP